MTGFRAHRHRPSPSSAHGTDHAAHAGRAWADGAAQSAPVVPTALVGSAAVHPPRLLRVVVTARPSRASDVRRMVSGELAHLRLPSEQLDNAVLATDELFANAVNHGSPDADGCVTVTVECTGRDVRVTVADSSPDLPRRRTAELAEECGRGLAIVAALTDDWGVAPAGPGETGKRVWFTLKIQGAS